MEDLDKFFDEAEKAFVVDYQESNGYTCSCCMQVWNETATFYDKEDLIKWLARPNTGNPVIDYTIWESVDDDNYRRLYELTEEDKEQIKAIQDKAKKAKDDAKLKREEALKVQKEKQDFEQFQELKKKFENK